MKPILTIALFFVVLLSAFTEDKTTELKYLVREPKVNSKKPPLLILLHGLGGNEKEFFALAGRIPDKYRVVSVRAPFTIGDSSYAWFHRDISTGQPVYKIEEAEQSRKKIIAVLCKYLLICK